MNPFAMILDKLRIPAATTSPKYSNALAILKLGEALHTASPVGFNGPPGPEVLRRVAAIVGRDAPAYRDLELFMNSVGAL
jgi:hypothetical protein